VSEPRRPGMVPSSSTVTPLAATRLPISPAKAEVFLRLKSPSSPWPTASCSRMPGQPAPSATSITPAGAARGVTVLDDGTIPGRRGSLTVDDEGTPSGKNVLIEDGILTGFMQDRQNARLMGVAPTGNGRRESFAHAPMPRMTNTYMLGGDADPAEVVAGVKDGIYAVGFGGGQVDITNGKFVFSCTEAYRVKDGKVGEPVKGATLIGDGATALRNIRAIGNDMALDPGIGNCGKAGQWVPVGVGQPTLLIGGLTVGGSAA
jgi:TldD protein